VLLWYHLDSVSRKDSTRLYSWSASVYSHAYTGLSALSFTEMTGPENGRKSSGSDRMVGSPQLLFSRMQVTTFLLFFTNSWERSFIFYNYFSGTMKKHVSSFRSISSLCHVHRLLQLYWEQEHVCFPFYHSLSRQRSSTSSFLPSTSVSVSVSVFVFVFVFVFVSVPVSVWV